jgi:demethylmenaquinone methyltransferase/2-methoxy-6-polyprenyl-1,4-benzoquinol methylase
VIDEAGWENVSVVQADATTPAIAPGSFDAAYAAMSLSAMPDPAAAVAAAGACLGPEGRIAVLDARPFQCVPLSLLNPLVEPVFGALTNWRPAIDVPAAIESTFETATVQGYHGGSIYVATGSRPGDAGPPGEKSGSGGHDSTGTDSGKGTS